MQHNRERMEPTCITRGAHKHVRHILEPWTDLGRTGGNARPEQCGDLNEALN